MLNVVASSQFSRRSSQVEWSKLELDAYHETGHVVMMAACGFKPVRVYIEGSEGEGKAFAEELPEPKNATEVEHLLRCGILCAAAGGAAEMLLNFKRRPQDGCRPPWMGTDQEKITGFLKTLGIHSVESEEFVKGVACVYLRNRAAYVEKIAHLLMERRSLQGTELSDLLDGVPTLDDVEWNVFKQRLQETSV